jgi:hypothetical protein
MDYHVLEARYVGDYVIWLRFRDGTAGERKASLRPEGAEALSLRRFDASLQPFGYHLTQQR